MTVLNALDRALPRFKAHSPLREASLWSSSNSASSDRGASERHLAVMMEGLRNRLLNPPANQERFHAVFVDRQRAFLGEADLGEGGPSALMLHLRPLFARALSLGADGMIMAHNHPSGDCRPSSGDIEATLRIAELAKSLEIELIDHLIFTHQSVYSMRRGGEL